MLNYLGSTDLVIRKPKTSLAFDCAASPNRLICFLFSHWGQYFVLACQFGIHSAMLRLTIVSALEIVILASSEPYDVGQVGPLMILRPLNYSIEPGRF